MNNTNSISSLQLARTPTLLKQSFNRLLIPRFLFSTLIIAEQLTVPIFLGWLIGANALAVIPVTAPITLFWGILESLFLRSTPILVSRARGENNYDQANRIFTVLIVTAFIFFSVTSIILYYFLPAIIEFFTRDKNVIKLSAAFYRVYLLAFPFYYVFTCTERVFALDGRAVFFSLRKVIQTIFAIVFPYFFISVLHFGIEGIALASMAKFFAAYSLILSHFFCKRRTIFFDFSHFFNYKETFFILHQSIKLGSPFASNYLLQTFNQSAINLLIGNIAGVQGLAVYSAVCIFYKIINKIDADIKSVICIMCGFLFGERDFFGLKKIFIYSIQWYLGISGIFCIIICLFAYQFCSLFNFSDPESIKLFVFSTYIFSIYIFLCPIFDIVTSYLVAVKKEWYSLYLSVIFPFSTTIIAYCLAKFIGFYSIWLAYSAGLIFSLFSLLYIMTRKTTFFPNAEYPQHIISYSFLINPQQIAAVVQELEYQLSTDKSSIKNISFIPLIVEELLILIKDIKQKDSSKLTADLRLEKINDHINISLSCSGESVAALDTLHNPELLQFNDINQRILNTIATAISYDRVMYLNYIRLQPDKKETIVDLCFLLNTENFSYVSELIERKMMSLKYSHTSSMLTALLVEEFCFFLYTINQRNNKTVHVCVTIRNNDKFFFITFSNDGIEYSKKDFFSAKFDSDKELFNKKILKILAHNCTCERVFEQNYLTLTTPIRD